jgi:hypothetical protein
MCLALGKILADAKPVGHAVRTIWFPVRQRKALSLSSRLWGPIRVAGQSRAIYQVRPAGRATVATTRTRKGVHRTDEEAIY